VAVVIMVMAHVVDSWTRESDRHDDRYFQVVFVNGLAAPLFLMLAGVALAMAAERKAETRGRVDAARAAATRGWQVFGLAFLFRLQAQLLGWGPFVNLLKVDILNVMGLAMLAAAGLWRAAAARWSRIALFGAATVAFTFLTPLVRQAAWLDPLPDPVEWYLRPAPSRTTFTMFPWAGFLTAGALVGELIDAARGESAAERRLHLGLIAGAAVGIVGGYTASFLPSIYAQSNFWTSSPTFFFIRLGVVLLPVPLAWLLGLAWGPLVTLGRSSLFVYWIHVEMVYGAFVAPIKRTLPLGGSIAATLVLCAILYVIVLLKNRWL
jgi:uncharacterized membrane protein